MKRLPWKLQQSELEFLRDALIQSFPEPAPQGPLSCMLPVAAHVT